MKLVSGKALWGVVCGSTVLPSVQVVKEELETATSHLQDGLVSFKPWTEASHQSWAASTKLKDMKKFVEKLGKLLDLSSDQAWEMFQLFLQHEYRGSTSQLASAGSNVREETQLLHQMWNFYLSDPLHLLSCLRHIITAPANHLLHPQFREFIEKKLDPKKTLGASLMNQLTQISGYNPNDTSSTSQSTTKKLSQPSFSSPHIPPKALYQWTASRLGAIKHLLATLIAYYAEHHQHCPPQTILDLLKMAQGGGLGQSCIDSIPGASSLQMPKQLLDVITCLHSLLLMLVITKNEDPQHHKLLSDGGWIPKINQIVSSLGSRTWHLPAILAWSVLQGRISLSEQNVKLQNQYQKLSERAIKGDVFTYIRETLKNPCIETDEFLNKGTSWTTFSLICNIASYLDLDSLGCINQVTSLAQDCMIGEPPADIFWSMDDSITDLLLPRTLEQFPQNPSLLLNLCTQLAKCSVPSALKVMQLLADLPNLTWVLNNTDDVTVSGGQVLALAPLSPIPGVIIPAGTSGTLIGESVVWNLSHSGWQFIQSAIKLLEAQVSSGDVHEWLLNTVILSLKLLTAAITTCPSQLSSFIHIRKEASILLVKVFQIMKPNYSLVAALLQFFAEVAKKEAKMVWLDLDESPMLPFLQKHGQANKRWRSDGLLGYKAGNIRALVSIDEKSTGLYPVLTSLCHLLVSALKRGILCSSVRGGIVFIVREVFPEILGYPMATTVEQVKVLLPILELLHHSLDINTDTDLQQLVMSDLVSGGARNTLRALIEHGALLEASLDQPSQLAHWPHSAHTQKMGQVAKTSLSLLHKLVSVNIDSSNDGKTNLSSLLLGTREVSNSAFTVTAAPAHLALTVARYIHNRLDPELPYLSLQTLTSLAQEVDVPLVACLGPEAEGIKDSLLMRLDSSTEDLRIKVALLRLLKAATVYQPGLLRLFLTPLPSFLDPLMSLLEAHYESNGSGDDLLPALLELLAALWGGNYATATAYLRTNQEFWSALCNPLFKNPDDVGDKLSCFTFQVLSMEYFVSQVSVAKDLGTGMEKFTDSSKMHLDSWSKYIMKTTGNSESKTEEAKLFLTSWRDFLVVIIKKSKSLLSSAQLSSLAEDTLNQLLILFADIDNQELFQVSLISELHLLLINNCSEDVGSIEYMKKLGDLLTKIRISVMKVSPKVQVLIFGSVLRCLTRTNSSKSECANILVEPIIHLVGQHCNLARGGSSTGHCSTPGVLTIITQLLHQCFFKLSSSEITMHLLNSSLLPDLAATATLHVSEGNSEVVESILSLFIHIAHKTQSPLQLTPQSLAESVSLALANEQNQALLGELIWALIAALEKEGILGIEGAISITAVHLDSLVISLLSPHCHPNLAFATSYLCANLFPHASIWRVNHQYCYAKLVSAVASCVHITTHLLSAPETFEKEMGFKTKSQINITDSKSLSFSINNLSKETMTLINQLLQILCASLRALRSLGPTLTDLLCKPGLDLLTWLPPVIQPSFRRTSPDHPDTTPNLATLSAVLDLYHTYCPKESRGTSPNKSGTTNTSQCSLTVLSQCAEEALYLLIVQSGLVLVSGDVMGREAREIRTFLLDETNGFFSNWLGRKSTQSPVLPSKHNQSSLTETHPDVNYLKVTKHIVESLCRAKLS